jgi:hypothetical protein
LAPQSSASRQTASSNTEKETIASSPGEPPSQRRWPPGLNQTAVWSNHVKPVSEQPQALAVDLIDRSGMGHLVSNLAVHEIWNTIRKADPGRDLEHPDRHHMFGGFHLIRLADGTPGMRLLIDRDKIRALTGAYKRGKDAKDLIESWLKGPGAAAFARLPYLLEASVGDARIVKAENDWRVHPHGQSYIQRILHLSGRDPTATLNHYGRQLTERLRGDLRDAQRDAFGSQRRHQAGQGQERQKCQERQEEVRGPMARYAGMEPVPPPASGPVSFRLHGRFAAGAEPPAGAGLLAPGQHQELAERAAAKALATGEHQIDWASSFGRGPREHAFAFASPSGHVTMWRAFPDYLATRNAPQDTTQWLSRVLHSIVPGTGAAMVGGEEGQKAMRKLARAHEAAAAKGQSFLTASLAPGLMEYLQGLSQFGAHNLDLKKTLGALARREAKSGFVKRYAGPVKQLGQYGPTKAPVIIDPLGTESAVRAVHTRLHGAGVPLEHLGSMAGAPDDSISVRLRENPRMGDYHTSKRGVGVLIDHPHFGRLWRGSVIDTPATMIFSKDAHGQKYVENVAQFILPQHQKSGLAGQMMARQLEHLLKLGDYKYMIAHAARENPMTDATRPATYDPAAKEHDGYWYWPKMGYNEDINSIGQYDPALASAMKAAYPTAGSVLDILDQPGGMAWWKHHGNDLFHATFDLNPAGRSMAVFNQRLKEITDRQAAKIAAQQAALPTAAPQRVNQPGLPTAKPPSLI